jgi:phthiocerol/phenolphthiocerol synthesis type-I polyketide synthase E
VLPLELSWLSVRHRDVAGPADLAALAAELGRAPADPAAGGDEPALALRGGRRWTQGFEPVTVPAGGQPDRGLPAGGQPDAGLPAGGVYLITGGTGGIGITVAEELARRAQARLVLLARGALPDRSEWDSYLAVHGSRARTGRAISAIQRMERLGAEVLVLTGDVTDAEDLRRARRATLDRFGRLDVIVHAAGVPGGGMAEVKARADAEAVLAPKLLGTLGLRATFGDLPLTAVVLCSSVTAVAGGFGQVDYCAANCFLDALARSGAGFRARVVSLNWGAWLDVGMAAEVEAPDAFRALQRGVLSTAIDHPLLTTAHHDPTTGTVWCTGVIGPATHWALADHRIHGRAVLPGTAHLEAARVTARAALAGAGCIELRDVVFLQPLALAADARGELRVAAAEGAEGLDFQVTSRTAGEEQAHVRGSAVLVDAGAAAVHDLAAIKARCRLGAVTPEQAGSHSGGMLSFGEHWSSLRAVHVGVEEELGRFELAEPFRAEPGWVLHPALLDEATSFGTSRGSGSYLPMGYGRVLVRGPLPARLWSHLRYRDSSEELLLADLTVMDDDGVEVVAITEFALRRVDPAAVEAGLAAGPAGQAARLAPATQVAPAAQVAPTAAAASALPDEVGIPPLDGAEALCRMLAVDLGPQVTVTAADVRATISGVRKVTEEAVVDLLAEGETVADRADGDLYMGSIPPRTDLERTVCELWESVLGVGRLGVDADFFDLGGNSLVAVQLIAEVRKAVGRKLPMRTLFEAPTIAGMAASNEQLADEPGADPASADLPPISPLAPRW